jgi:ribosome maturation factor RimP
MSSVDSAIRGAITPIILEADLFLEALQISSAGKHRVIRILVDRRDPRIPLSLDEVTAVTKPISASLDSLSALGEHPFTLEVSSPGVDFPLSLPRHWVKNQNRLAAITLKTGEKYIGRITSSDETSATITIEGKKVETRTVAFEDISHANIEIEFK